LFLCWGFEKLAVSLAALLQPDSSSSVKTLSLHNDTHPTLYTQFPHPTHPPTHPPTKNFTPRLAKVLTEMFEALNFTFSDLAASIILVGVTHRSRARAAGTWGFGRLASLGGAVTSEGTGDAAGYAGGGGPVTIGGAAAGLGAAGLGEHKMEQEEEEGAANRKQLQLQQSRAAPAAGAHHHHQQQQQAGRAAHSAAGGGGGGAGNAGAMRAADGGEGEVDFELLEEALHWHRYANAIYGWPMFMWSHRYR